MRDALADRVDARIERLQRVVDDDAAVAVQAGGLGERDVGPDADRHHDEVGGQRLAGGEPHARDAARLAGDERFGLRFEAEREALRFERLLQHLRGRAVELALHQPRHEVHDRDVHAAQLEAVRRLEPEQPAADHDGVAMLARGRDHRFGVGDVAIGDHAGQVDAGNRQDERGRARGEQQAVVGAPRCRRRLATTRRARSMRVTVLPACSVMPFSAYHSRELSTISSSVCSPASTGDSRMRL